MNLVWLDISASHSHSSLALPAIEACRTGDDYNWSVVRGTTSSEVYLLTKELHAQQPTIIATTLWLFNHSVVTAICSRIKALLPQVIIIAGGPEFNGDNHSLLRRYSFLNYAFRGEGEVEFHNFLAGKDPALIKGLCYIDHQGNYHDNGTARVDRFDELAAPESSQFFNFDSPFVQLEFSRGCFNNCAFCVSGGDKPIRNRPTEQIENRIESCRQRGIKDIRVLDRTFNYSPSRAEQMLRLFTKFPEMNFHLEIHPALLSDELLKLLEAMPAGLLHLEAGMQSLSDEVIEACGRIGSNKAAIAGLERLCRIPKFETHADLIAGLPHYTLPQIFSDVRRLSIIGAHEIQLELLKLLPGTKMRREAAENGIKYAPSAPYEVLETPAITIDELDRARLLSKLIDKFYNAKGWQEVTRTMINENSSFLEEFLNFLQPTALLEKPLSLERRGELLHQFCHEKMEGRYTDLVAMAWIENGISLRKPQAGNCAKAKELPQGVERRANVHYYIWQGETKRVVYGFDRSVDHSRPTIKVEF